MCKYLLSVIIILVLVILYMGNKLSSSNNQDITPPQEKFVRFRDNVSYAEFDINSTIPQFIAHLPLNNKNMSSKESSDNRYDREYAFKNRSKSSNFTIRQQYDMGDTKIVSNTDTIVPTSDIKSHSISEISMSTGTDRDSRKPYNEMPINKSINQILSVARTY